MEKETFTGESISRRKILERAHRLRSESMFLSRSPGILYAQHPHLLPHGTSWAMNMPPVPSLPSR